MFSGSVRHSLLIETGSLARISTFACLLLTCSQRNWDCILHPSAFPELRHCIPLYHLRRLSQVKTTLGKQTRAVAEMGKAEGTKRYLGKGGSRFLQEKMESSQTTHSAWVKCKAQTRRAQGEMLFLPSALCSGSCVWWYLGRCRDGFPSLNSPK